MTHPGFLTLLIMGIIGVAIGGSGLAGLRRIDYLVTHPWSGGGNYGALPLGIWALLLAVSGLITNNWDHPQDYILTYTVAYLGPIAFLMIFIRPWFMQPKWYRWLLEEHADILYLLRYDARRNRETVKHRIQTQEGLEAWVAEVRQKKEYNNITDFTTH